MGEKKQHKVHELPSDEEMMVHLKQVAEKQADEIYAKSETRVDKRAAKKLLDVLIAANRAADKLCSRDDPTRDHKGFIIPSDTRELYQAEGYLDGVQACIIYLVTGELVADNNTPTWWDEFVKEATPKIGPVLPVEGPPGPDVLIFDDVVEPDEPTKNSG